METLLRDAKFTDATPEILAEEPWMDCLAETAREEIRGLLDREFFCSIYNRLDDLPEWALDAIAPNIRCDFYRETDDIQTKRDNIRLALWGNNIKGTVAATEMLAGAVFGREKAWVEEWFDYGDDPGYFQIVIYNWGTTDAQLEDFIVRMDGYKRLSIWLRRFLITVTAPMEELKFGAGLLRSRRTMLVRMNGMEFLPGMAALRLRRSMYVMEGLPKKADLVRRTNGPGHHRHDRGRAKRRQASLGEEPQAAGVTTALGAAYTVLGGRARLDVKTQSNELPPAGFGRRGVVFCKKNFKNF
ncbi:MAG: phage tail protein [Oscillospiraceae bacterium]|jgi:hypothetical protein|nr:phage tail protein [Oscillospiraceae bacterium]